MCKAYKKGNYCGQRSTNCKMQMWRENLKTDSSKKHLSLSEPSISNIKTHHSLLIMCNIMHHAHWSQLKPNKKPLQFDAFGHHQFMYKA